jgi:hypothetical protein
MRLHHAHWICRERWPRRFPQQPSHSPDGGNFREPAHVADPFLHWSKGEGPGFASFNFDGVFRRINGLNDLAKVSVRRLIESRHRNVNRTWRGGVAANGSVRKKARSGSHYNVTVLNRLPMQCGEFFQIMAIRRP